MGEQATWTEQVHVSVNTQHVGPTKGPWTVSVETLEETEEQTRGG